MSRDAAQLVPTSVASRVAEVLHGAGVRHCFGVLGSTNFAVTRRLVDLGVGFTAARQETHAVAMADAWSQVTQEVGVVSVHAGPGLTNGVMAIAEAVKSRTPLVVLAGDVANGAVTSNFIVDQSAVAASVGAIPERLHSPATALADTQRAVERARRERTVVVLNLPLDVQGADIGELPAPTPTVALAPSVASPEEVRELADLLVGAQRPLFIAGRGAVLADAEAALTALAERTGALVATTARGHGVFADEPFNLGISGGFSSPAALELIPQADVVVGFGASLTRWTTKGGVLLQGAAHVVQVDVEPERIGHRHPVTMGVVSDAARLAADLASELERRGHDAGGWRTDATREIIATRGHNTHDYEDRSVPGALDPRTVTKKLDEILPADRTVAIDGGHFMSWPARHLRLPDPAAWVFTQSFQSIGLGLASAVGAAVADPGRLTVAALGDGGGAMGIAELETAVRLGLDLLVVVYNDSAYGAEIHHFGPLGAEVDLAEFADVDFARIGRGFGAEGATVRSLEDLEQVQQWVQRGARGVLVVDMKISREVVADWLEEAFKGDTTS